MFIDWFAPSSVDDFKTQYFQKTPIANTGTAVRATALLDWEVMGRVLASPQPLDLVTVASGRLVDAPAPRSIDELRRLMRAGVSVVVRDGECHDPGLRQLADAVEAELPGVVHVQLYATPGGTNSYGWHYDFEDVFIAQAAGAKDYYFRANTVAHETRLGDILDFQVFRQEHSPIFSSRLLPADSLYIPSRWWHLVTCSEDSLSISVGVMPPAELAAARKGDRRRPP
jgi:50S ribosomal protein L16 3-hydroxylase